MRDCLKAGRLLLLMALLSCQNVSPLSIARSAGEGVVRRPAVSKALIPVVNVRGVVQMPSALIAQGGGSLVASGGGNLIAAGGGNIIANGGGNLVTAPAAYALLETVQADHSNVEVFLADGSGQVIAGLPIVRCDRAGQFVIPRVPAMLVYQVVARLPLRNGGQVSFQSLVQPSAQRGAVEVNPASTVVASAVLQSSNQKLAPFDDVLFARAKRVSDDVLKAKSSVDWTAAGAVESLREAVVSAAPELKVLVTDVSRQIATAPPQAETRVKELVTEAIVQTLPPKVREELTRSEATLTVTTGKDGAVVLNAVDAEAGTRTEVKATVETNSATGASTTQTAVLTTDSRTGKQTTASTVTVTATDDAGGLTTSTTVDMETGSTTQVRSDLTTGTASAIGSGEELMRSPEPVQTAQPSKTPEPVQTAKPSQTPEPVQTAQPSKTPEPVQTAQPSKTPEPVQTAQPSQTPQPVQTAKPTPTPVTRATSSPSGALTDLVIGIKSETKTFIDSATGLQGTESRSYDSTGRLVLLKRVIAGTDGMPVVEDVIDYVTQLITKTTHVYSKDKDLHETVVRVFIKLVGYTTMEATYSRMSDGGVAADSVKATEKGNTTGLSF